MNIYVYEDQQALKFEPLSLTRPVFDIRIGSETFLDRIKYLFPKNIYLFYFKLQKYKSLLIDQIM